MKKLISIFAVVALAACSAQIESENGLPAESQADRITFSFSTETVAAHIQSAAQTTKTTMDASMNVSWTAGDKITVFANGTPTPFTADNDGSSTTFSGTDPGSATAYYALYPHNPYDIAASISGNVISTVIPNFQTGVKDGFDPLAQVMVGRSTDGGFQMKNAVALVKISIPADVTSVTLATNSGTMGLAGKTDITVGDDGVPTAVTATARSVLLVPSGETFEVGDYYIAVAPGAVAGGLKIFVTKSSDNNIYSVSSDATATFYRSQITALKNVESKLASQATTVLTLTFVDNVASPTTFANPFYLPDGTSSPSFATSNYANPVEEPESFFLDKGAGARWQYRIYSNYGITRQNTQGLRFGRTEGDFVELPKINGQKLAAVCYVPGNSSYQGYPAICDAAGDVMNGGNEFRAKLPTGKYIYWMNPDAATATNYYLRCMGSANQITMRQLKLYYTGTAAATPGNAKTSAAEVSGTHVTFKGSTNRNSTALAGWSEYSSGFEYRLKAQGWSDAVNIDKGAMSGASFSHTIELADGEYVYRAWVSIGDVKVLGNPVSFVTMTSIVDPKYTVSYTSYPTGFNNTVYPLTGSWNTDYVNKYIPLIPESGEHLVLQAYCVPTAGQTSGLRYLSRGIIFANAEGGSHVLLPGINGLKLVKVVVSNGASTKNTGKWSVIDETLTDDKSDVSGGDAVSFVVGGDNTFTLSGTSAGKAYKLYSSVNVNPIELGAIELSYEGTEEPTVMYVCPTTYSAGTVSATVYVNGICTLSDLSGGFQYKAGGAGDWVSLGAASFDALSSGVTTASLAVDISLDASDVIRAYVSDGTKTVYSPETTIGS